MKTASRIVLTLGVSVGIALSAVSVRAQVLSPHSGRLDPVTRLRYLSDSRVMHHASVAQAQALSADDLSTFQTNLQTLVKWLSTAPSTNPNQQSVVNDLQNQISGLTPDQMTTLAGYVDVAGFNTAINTLTSTKNGQRVLPPTDPPANLSPPQYGICAPTNGPPSIPSDPATEHALLITLEVLEGLQIVADDFANLDEQVVGEGTNVALVIVAIVADEIVFALQTTKDQLEFCDLNVEASQVTSNWQNTIVIDTDIANLGSSVNNYFTTINNQLTAIANDVDTHLATIANTNSTDYTQVNNVLNSIRTNLNNQMTAIDTDIDQRVLALDTDVNNVLINVDADIKNTSLNVQTDVDAKLGQLDKNVLSRATQIDTEIGTYQSLDLRIEIESALAQNTSLESFQVPQALGGNLELVRSIVSDVISKLLAAGQTVNNATKWMALGDSALAAKQYKSAYVNYAAAYQTAVK